MNAADVLIIGGLIAALVWLYARSANAGGFQGGGGTMDPNAGASGSWSDSGGGTSPSYGYYGGTGTYNI